MKEQLQNLIEALPMMKELVFPAMGYQADDTIENLQEMETVINAMYPEGHKPLMTTVLSFGLHLGDVVIKAIPGARWELDNIDDPIDIQIHIPMPNKGSSIVKPVKRVAKFWHDRTDTIYGWANMLKDMSEGNLNLKDREGEWVTRPDGTQTRMISVSLDEITDEKLEELSEQLGREITREEIEQMVQSRKRQYH